MSLQTHSHLRRNLLTGEWVLVSPHRTQRPWQGQVEPTAAHDAARYDPACYLCPGNERAGGQRNPDYSGPFAFDNDFPALSRQSETGDSAHPMLAARAMGGCCRVLCFTERHDLSLAGMGKPELVRAFEFMTAQFSELDQQADIAYVQVFENRGRMMGCSNPHPHAQVWASSAVPNEPARELKTQSAYYQAHGRSLLLDYLLAETGDGSRMVCENEHAVALVPFWAVWPFETLLLPRRARSAMDELSAAELAGFATLLQQTLAACDSLFACSTPYSMGFHPRPSDGRHHPEWQLHAHIYPPLLRSASVRKHQVGFEMLGMPQRDLTPEVAADKLRAACAGWRPA